MLADLPLKHFRTLWFYSLHSLERSVSRKFLLFLGWSVVSNFLPDHTCPENLCTKPVSLKSTRKKTGATHWFHTAVGLGGSPVSSHSNLLGPGVCSPRPCFHVNVSVDERKQMQRRSAVEAQLPLTQMGLGIFFSFPFSPSFACGISSWVRESEEVWVCGCLCAGPD